MTEFFKKFNYISHDKGEICLWNGYSMDKSVIDDTVIANIRYQSNGAAWAIIGDDRPRIARLDYLSAKWVTIEPAIGLLMYVFDIAFDKDDTLYVTSLDHEVYVVKNSTVKKLELPEKVAKINISSDNILYGIVQEPGTLLPKYGNILKYNLTTKESSLHKTPDSWFYGRLAVYNDKVIISTQLSAGNPFSLYVWDTVTDVWKHNTFVTRDLNLSSVSVASGNLEFIEIKYLTDDPSTNHTTNVISVGKHTLENKTSVEQTLTFEFKKTLIKSVEVDARSTLGGGFNQTFKINGSVPVIGGANANTEMAMEFSYTDGKTETTTTTEEYTLSCPVKVAPQSSITAICLITRGILDCPYEATFKNAYGIIVTRKGRVISENNFDIKCTFN